jgi:tripeptidyl-peptidase-1
MGDWVQFTTTVEHANTLFNASYQTFVHQGTSQTLTRTLSYSLPQALVGHVNTVLPTTSFDAQNARLVPAPKQTVKRAIPGSCNTTITPSCLQVRQSAQPTKVWVLISDFQDLYQIPKTPATDKKNTLLVASYDLQWAQTSDLAVCSLVCGRIIAGVPD